MKSIKIPKESRVPTEDDPRTTSGSRTTDLKALLYSQHTTFTGDRKQCPTLSAGFEPAIPGSERPKTHCLSRAATETG
jgi:hypothetical protein